MLNQLLAADLSVGLYAPQLDAVTSPETSYDCVKDSRMSTAMLISALTIHPGPVSIATTSINFPPVRREEVFEGGRCVTGSAVPTTLGTRRSQRRQRRQTLSQVT